MLCGIAKITRDVTDRKRAEEALRLNEARLQALLQLNQMAGAPLQEITDFALESAVALTSSKIGYLAFLNDDETVLTMHSWSKEAMAECAIIDKPIVYQLVSTGLWGEAVRQRKPVITNDYQAPNPLKKGYPEGHVSVARHMNAPVFDGERIVIVAGVGNKETPYDESDVRQLTLLMQGIWQLLQRRHFQERLAHLNAALRAVRNVNQLISREKQRDRLLEGVCRCLVEARGYQQAWAFLPNRSDTTEIWANSGVGDAWPLLVERMRQGEPPPCIQQCFDRSGIVIADEDRCAAAFCPIASRCRDTDAVAVRLQHQGEIHGVLAVTLPRGLSDDPAERALLEEVAGDVAFALHGISLDEQRALAEQALRTARDELEMRVQERTADLTRANAELEQAKQAAEAASRAKSTFLANMSHEIRTPLNAVIGMTELVLKGQLSSRQRDFLMTVRDSGEALLSVINDILDFSKIEAGKLALDNSTFDLWESLGDTMKSFAIRAQQRGLELTCRIDPDVPHLVHGDYNRLRQVVVNLVGNAVKFTEQGEVSVDVAQDSRSPHDVVLHFVVNDTGIGIPEGKRATIFEMFEQADSSSRRRYGGTGLGLAIAARLVDLMGGRLWLESEVGRGSRFHFTVHLGLAEGELQEPVALEPGCPQGMPVRAVDNNATNRRSAEKSIPGLQILLAEDSLVNQKLAIALLEGQGHTVALVNNGKDAVAASGRQKFDLVLMDVQMPELDGLEATAQIRAREQRTGTHLPIIAMTAHALKGDRERCLAAGMDSYVAKPIRAEELFETMEAVFSDQKAAPAK